MPRKAVAFMLACALVSTSAYAQTQTPLRIASTSLCGDGYILALTPDQAVALSWQSRDALSRAPENMRVLPQLWDDPETLVNSDVDLILLGPGEGKSAADLLSKTNINTHALVWGEDFKSIMNNVTLFGNAARQTARAESFNAQIKSRLEALKTRTDKRATTPKVLYISRSGGSAGPGTFIDEAINAAGGINTIKAPGWQTPDPEFILSLKPDVILTSFFSQGYESVQAKGQRHKVMARYIAAHPNIDVPGALWPCAGPGLIEAAELIADGLDTLP